METPPDTARDLVARGLAILVWICLQPQAAAQERRPEASPLAPLSSMESELRAMGAALLRSQPHPWTERLEPKALRTLREAGVERLLPANLGVTLYVASQAESPGRWLVGRIELAPDGKRSGFSWLWEDRPAFSRDPSPFPTFRAFALNKPGPPATEPLRKAAGALLQHVKRGRPLPVASGRGPSWLSAKRRASRAKMLDELRAEAPKLAKQIRNHSGARNGFALADCNLVALDGKGAATHILQMGFRRDLDDARKGTFSLWKLHAIASSRR